MIRVIWFAPPEVLQQHRDISFSGLDIKYSETLTSNLNNLDLAILDSRLFRKPNELLTARKTLSMPALILVGEEELTEVISWFRDGDTVLMHDSPLQLITWHVKHTFRFECLLNQRDSLTKLANRRKFQEHLSVSLLKVSETHSLSVMILDIDSFKKINDVYGHAAGDQLLIEIAECLASCTRDALLARYGGEEFVIVLQAGEKEAIYQAELMREAICSSTFYQGIRATISIGVATTDEPINASIIIRQADQALYIAKGNGRNQTVHYQALERETLRTGKDIEILTLEKSTQILADRLVNAINYRERRVLQKLKQQADLDSLTGLYSRRYLDRRLKFEFEENKKLEVPLIVALLDIDYFGQVNKKYGWPTGDDVLTDVALLIRQNVRQSDWVARYGGEEVCIIMTDLILEPAVMVLERIRKVIADYPFTTSDGSLLQLTVSIGVTESSTEDNNLSTFMERVSKNLLQAKQGGRNQICKTSTT